MTEYPIGTCARIEVGSGLVISWPVVERVAGGWQSGAHHYPDSTVLTVQVLPIKENS